MEYPPISTVLLGRDNSTNNTIIDLLKDEQHINIRHWKTESPAVCREVVTSSKIDVLIADLTSVTGSPSDYLTCLAGKQFFKAILAMHLYTSWQVVNMLLEAGAAGYVTVSAGPQIILKAIQAVNNGERFVWTGTNAVGEKA